MAEVQKVRVEDYNIDIGLYTGPLLRGKPEGDGRLACYNGDSYEGQWKAGLFHGKGRYVFADGNIYDGEWESGKRTGYGVFTWPAGDRYEGQFANGKRHGQGTYWFSNGNVFTGAWENGKRNGPGKLTYADGSVQTGRWQNSEYVPGSGTITPPAPVREYRRVEYQSSYYEGPIVNGKRHGWGKLVWNDGERYRGDFVNGDRTGQGTYHFKNGSVYKGEFLKNKMHGKGFFRRKDGSSQQGRWENGVYVPGSGTVTPPVLGRWKDYLELYDWWDMGLGNTAFYNERFRLLRARGNAQQIVRSKIGGDDLSGVRRGDVHVCMFILERFVPRGADRELLARCFYLTEQFRKAAGVVAMTIRGNEIRRYLLQELSPSTGLAMEIMAAHYLNKAEYIIQSKRAMVIEEGFHLNWVYAALRALKTAREYLHQAEYVPAKYEPNFLEIDIEKLEGQLGLF